MKYQVGGVTFSPDGNVIAIACDRGVVLWDVVRERPFAEDPLPVEGGAFGSVAFSPDGKVIAIQVDNSNMMPLFYVATRERLSDAAFDVPLRLRRGLQP